jgi:hypothetical protein
MRASRQVTQPDRTHLIQRFGMPPDLQEGSVPHISAGKGELHARIHVAVRRNVTGRVPRAARKRFEKMRGL